MTPGVTLGDGVEKLAGSDVYSIGDLAAGTARGLRARDANN